MQKEKLSNENGSMLIHYLYLIYNENKVQVGEKYNTEFQTPMFNGVLQGSALSPLLFDIYIDNLLDTLQNRIQGLQIYAFADDIMLHNYTITELRRTIQDINKWCTQNKMNLNMKKCGIL